MALNFADLFEHAADTFAERTAVACGNRRVTYRELEERVNRLAHQLAGLGVGPGDHVGLYARNSIEAIETLIAAAKLRASAVKVMARQEPVSYDGKHYQLPLLTGTGKGRPLRSILHPYRTEIPVYLGAEGPKNVALAAEIADGWNAIFFSPAMSDFYATALAEGFARPGARHARDTFDVVGGPLAIVGPGPRSPTRSSAGSRPS